MHLISTFTDDGIFYSQDRSTPLQFPLMHHKASDIPVAEWSQLNALEQLWYADSLVYSQEQQGYLLPTAQYFALDEETKSLLQFPPQDVQLSIQEVGHMGYSSYQIRWSALFRGRSAIRVQRRGACLTIQGDQHMLTQAQWELLELLDTYEDENDIYKRGTLHSQATKLAEASNTQMSRFTTSRQFVYAQEADYKLDATSQQEIQIQPTLKDVPESLSEQLPTRIDTVNTLGTARQPIHVLVAPEAKKAYQEISEIPPITGAQVPVFIENPAVILPEEFDCFSDAFSQRVKGLKIRCSKAVPFLHIEPSPERTGWFDAHAGFTLQPINDQDDLQDEVISPTPELQALMEEAVLRNEKYVFYQEQWVKIDSSVQQAAEKACELLGETGENTISAQQRNYILDIYENLTGVEYNEAILTMQTPLSHYAFPDCFHATPYPHQIEGYQFLRTHHETQVGSLLADDMGLGKTIQVIALLAHLFQENQLATALLVMPKSLLDNWKKELNQFLPDAKNIYIHQGAQRYRSIVLIKRYDIVLTTYETLARDQTILGQLSWSCIICDEVQKIKNFQTVAANAVKGMNSKCRIALTGTPVENRLSELWSITDFVQPGLLGSYQSFRKIYEQPIQNGGEQAENLAQNLVDTLAPVFLRRTKDEVLADQLPTKSDYSITLPLDGASEKMYQLLIQQSQGEKGMVLATIQRLIMLCSHPALVTHNGNGAQSLQQIIKQSPKLTWTMGKLKEIQSQNEKCIIFTKYKEMQGILRYAILDQFGIDAPIINGEVTGNRLAILDTFSQRPGFGVLILSPRAAGVGLTITAANHVIHYTREWNPAVENQATDRVYRIGQHRPVSVYYPTMVSSRFLSAEEKLAQLLDEKRALMKRVVIPTNLELKLEDFEEILEPCV